MPAESAGKDGTNVQGIDGDDYAEVFEAVEELKIKTEEMIIASEATLSSKETSGTVKEEEELGETQDTAETDAEAALANDDEGSLTGLMIAESMDSPSAYVVEQEIEPKLEEDAADEESPKLESQVAEVSSVEIPLPSPPTTASASTQLLQDQPIAREDPSQTVEKTLAAVTTTCEENQESPRPNSPAELTPEEEQEKVQELVRLSNNRTVQKSVERNSQPFILPKPVAETTVEKSATAIFPMGITSGQKILLTPSVNVSNEPVSIKAKPASKKPKATGANSNKEIAKKPTAKPKQSPKEKLPAKSKSKKMSPTMIITMPINPMDSMAQFALQANTPSTSTSKPLTKPRKRPPKKPIDKANSGKKQSPEKSQNGNNCLSPGNANGNLMMATAGVPNMIFPNQLAVAPNGNLIAMPGYMQLASNQQNGQFIPVMSSPQLFLAMQQQQQQSDNHFGQCSSAQSAVVSSKTGVPLIQTNFSRDSHNQNPAGFHGDNNSNGLMNASNLSASIVQQPQLMSSNGGNQMFFRLTSKNGMLVPTLVSNPSNISMNQNRNSSGNVGVSMHQAQSSSSFNQQQKFIQPRQIMASSSSSGSSSSSTPIPQLGCRLAPSSSTAVNSFLSQQSHQQSQAHQLSHLTSLTNSQLAAALHNASSSSTSSSPVPMSATMPRLVQITPSPISGSSLSANVNSSRHQQVYAGTAAGQVHLQSAWDIPQLAPISSSQTVSVAGSNVRESRNNVSPTSSLNLAGIFPQQQISSSGNTSKETVQRQQFRSLAFAPPQFSTSQPPQSQQQQKAPSKKKRKTEGTPKCGDSAQSSSTSAPSLNSQIGLTNDEEENEPPPVLLCRDELGRIDNFFLREAAIMHERFYDANGNKKSPIKHVIGGYVIEEDMEPFPCQHKELLDSLGGFQSLEEEEEEVDEEEPKDPVETDLPSINKRGLPAADADNDTNDEDDSDNNNYLLEKRRKMRKKKSSMDGDRRDSSDRYARPMVSRPKKRRTISSSSSTATPPIFRKTDTMSATDKKQSRKNREIESLLTMDFGPGKTPFQTTSIDEYTEEVMEEAQQQKRSVVQDERSGRRSCEGSHVNLPSMSSNSSSLFMQSSKSSKPKEKHSHGHQVGRPPHLPHSNEPAVSPTVPIDTLASEESVKTIFSSGAYTVTYPKKQSSVQQSKSIQEKRGSHPMSPKPMQVVQGNPGSESGRRSVQQLESTGGETTERNVDTTQMEYQIQKEDQAMLWGDERCIYCKLMFRELKKRHQENPQYCSKTCRRKFKKQKSAGGSTGVSGTNEDNYARGNSDAPSTSGSRRSVNIDNMAFMTEKQGGPTAPQITGTGLSAFSSTKVSPPSLKIKLQEQEQQSNLQLTEEKLRGRTNSFMLGRQSTAEFRDESSPELVGYGIGQAGGNLMNFMHQPATTSVSSAGFPLPHHHHQLFHFPHHPAMLTSENVSHFLQRDSPVSTSSGMVFPGVPGALMALAASPAPSSNPPLTPTGSAERNAELEMLIGRGVQSWGPTEVARWVNIVTNSDSNGDRFLQEQVDGIALCYLTLPNLQNELGFKLGPAVKLNNSINALRIAISASGTSIDG